MAQLIPLPLTVSCSSEIQIGFTFLVPADLGSPGQRAVKRVCVCVCVFLIDSSTLSPVFSVDEDVASERAACVALHAEFTPVCLHLPLLADRMTKHVLTPLR